MRCPARARTAAASDPARPPPTMATSVTIVSDAVAAIGSIAHTFTVIVVGSVNGDTTAIFLPGTPFTGRHDRFQANEVNGCVLAPNCDVPARALHKDRCEIRSRVAQR